MLPATHSETISNDNAAAPGRVDSVMDVESPRTNTYTHEQQDWAKKVNELTLAGGIWLKCQVPVAHRYMYISLQFTYTYWASR